MALPARPEVSGYVEPGGSWRAFWLAAGALAVLLVLDRALPGAGVPASAWALAVVVVLGVVAAGILSARRIWTVRVGGRGPDAAPSVGREAGPLAGADAAGRQSGVVGLRAELGG